MFRGVLFLSVSEFKLIIAGSRDITNPEVLAEAFEKLSESMEWAEPTEIVSGTARGVDRLGEAWATERSIPIARFPPGYKKYGRYRAPKKRNQEMVDYAHALLLVWNGATPGSHDILNRAKKRKILYFEHITKEI